MKYRIGMFMLLGLAAAALACNAASGAGPTPAPATGTATDAPQPVTPTVAPTDLPPTDSPTQAPADTAVPPTATDTPPDATPAVITAENAAQLAVAGQTRLAVDPLHAIVYAPDGATAAVAANDEVILYDSQTWTPTGQLPVDSYLWKVQYAADGALLLAIPAADGVAQLFSLDGTDVSAANASLSAAQAHVAALSPDGTLLVGSNPDGEIWLWDVASGAAVGAGPLPFSVEVPPVGVLAFSPDGRTLGIGDNGSFYLWSIDQQAAGPSYTAVGRIAGPIAIADMSPGWDTLAWISRGTVIFIDPASDTEIARLSHQDFVVAYAWSPDGTLFATAVLQDVDGVIQPVVDVWEVRTGERLAVLTGFEPNISGLAFSPDGTQIVAAETAGSLSVWQVAP